MPNHFHLMVLVNFEELVIEEIYRMTPSHPINATKTRSFNNSIAILLRSYTRAINKQRNRSGSLFKAHTKAECVNCNNGIAPPFINDTESNSTLINSKNPENQYPQICFNYIHQNPVKANLVKFAVDWEFSSAADYYAGRNGKIIKRDLVAEYLDIPGKFK
jgi:putative transposase